MKLLGRGLAAVAIAALSLVPATFAQAPHPPGDGPATTRRDHDGGRRAGAHRRGRHERSVDVVIETYPPGPGGASFPGYPCDPGPCDATAPADVRPYPTDEGGPPDGAGDGAIARDEVAAADANAAIELHIVPETSIVLVDGQPLGEAKQFDRPDHLLWLPAGRHELALEANGRRWLTTTLDLAPGRTQTVRYRLWARPSAPAKAN